jgi:hypothetical protein
MMDDIYFLDKAPSFLSDVGSSILLTFSACHTVCILDDAQWTDTVRQHYRHYVVVDLYLPGNHRPIE